MFTDPKNILKKFGFIPGMIVADCGSGIGHFTIPIAQIVAPIGYVYAVDVHRDILTRLTNDAKEHKLTNVHTVWGDIEQPNGTHLKDASVDYVLLANVLHQTKDKPMVLRETLRILKDEGSVLVIDSTSKNFQQMK